MLVGFIPGYPVVGFKRKRKKNLAKRNQPRNKIQTFQSDDVWVGQFLKWLDFSQIHALLPGEKLLFHSAIPEKLFMFWVPTTFGFKKKGTHFLMATFSPFSTFWASITWNRISNKIGHHLKVVESKVFQKFWRVPGRRCHRPVDWGTGIDSFWAHHFFGSKSWCLSLMKLVWWRNDGWRSRNGSQADELKTN